MTTDEQPTDPYDPDHLAATTPYPLHEWQKARQWIGPQRWPEVAPLILDIGGRPEPIAKTLGMTLRDPMYGDPTAAMSPQARRYAEAIAAAAAADARVAALVDMVSLHAFHRDLAEQQLSAVDWDDRMPKVWDLSDGEPPTHIVALLDLSDGTAYIRRTLHGGSVSDDWVKAAAALTNSTIYEWPIADAGPFIAMPEAWALNRVNEEAARRDRQESVIRAAIRQRDGYDDPEKRLLMPPLDEAIVRVIHALERRMVDYSAARAQAEQELHVLRRAIGRLVDQEEADGHGVTYEQLRALLPSEEPSPT